MNTWEVQKKIHEAVKNNLAVGMTELELADIISSVCSDWRGDVISGERTADIEGGPTDRVIKSGDVVLLDLQVYSENMWSDITRVYFMDNVTYKMQEAYDSVLKALREGEAMLRPCCVGSELWNSMRKSIGSEYAFEHHGGHLIDKDNFYLPPSFVDECDCQLEEGMVVTLEPALYYPGEFGIRLENNYLITADGYKKLCDLPLDLANYILKG